MAAKQTRRSISVSRPTYERIKAHSVLFETSMSAVVERLIKKFLDSDDAKVKPVRCENPHHYASSSEPDTVPVSAPPVDSNQESTDDALNTMDTVHAAASKHFTF